MASPPFNINQALPGDSDIVSQHPGNARTFRDVVESWLLINHDTNGNHARVDIPRTASPTTPAASIDVLYVTLNGRLKIKHPDASEEYVGNPPGSIIYYSGASIPTGYLDPDGSAVSRSTFADLFGIVSTGYGAGDGSTTFNLPNIKGRVIAGYDVAASLLTTAGSGVDSSTLGAIGGVQNHVLTVAQLPPIVSTNTGAIALTVTPNVATGRATNNSTSFVGGGSVSFFYADTSASVLSSATGTLAIGAVAVTSNNTISSAHPNVQPTIILRVAIKY